MGGQMMATIAFILELFRVTWSHFATFGSELSLEQKVAENAKMT